MKTNIDGIMYICKKLENSNLSEQEKAYYQRILRVLQMPDLTRIAWNPVNLVVERIKSSDYFQEFEIFTSPEIVGEYETFDLFYFPEDHVARRPSDSYFLEKTPNKTENILLRPHTTVMWYHYLVNSWGIETLQKNGKINILSYGKTYRVDELDKTHHECFHQIDGLRIIRKDAQVITQETLKELLSNTIEAIFWEPVEHRFNADSFPYTIDSLEVEVRYGDSWIEVLGAGIVHPTVLEKLGVDSSLYNGWAFGFGIERLAMVLKKIPDIRIFWSQDSRITSQWGNFDPYIEVSTFPPVYKDISLIVPKTNFKILEQTVTEIHLTRETESSLFAITGIIRDIGKDLIESVKIIDWYENDEKFEPSNTSITLNITFRSLERTLTNEEINTIYFGIRRKIESELWYVLR